MKKFTIFLAVILFTVPLWAKTKPSVSYRLAEAIATSNYKKVKKLLPALQDNKNNQYRKHLFFIASFVCLPDSPTIVNYDTDYYYIKNYPKEIKPVCKKEENAKIIELFLEGNNKDDAAYLVHYQDGKESNKNTETVKLLTPLYYLKKSRPDLIPQIADKLDQCTVALTQMQELTPKDPYYYSYADFYRDNKCALNKDDVIDLESIKYSTVGFGEKGSSYSIWETYTLEIAGDMVLDLGMSKMELFEKMGMPSYYETPSEFREIITYRVLEQSYSSQIVRDYIYTLDRDVITKVERKTLGSEMTMNIYKKDYAFDGEEDVMKKYETEEKGY